MSILLVRLTKRRTIGKISRRVRVNSLLGNGVLEVISTRSKERVRGGGAYSNSNRGEMNDFFEFNESMELTDVPVLGNKLTWFKLDGRAMSILDRFILTKGLIDKWSIGGQMVGSRELSDHYTIWIKGSEVNWGPKPFKFFSYWVKHPYFFPGH